MVKCEHDLAEMETECADGTCPICQRVQAIRMRCALASLVEEILATNDHGGGAHDDGCSICQTIRAAEDLLREYDPECPPHA